MKVCHFGIFNPHYPRNAIIKKGLELQGVEVLEYTDRGKGLSKYARLWNRHRKLRDSYDVMLIGFPGQAAAPIARIFVRRPVVLDAFLSLYDTNVLDRKRAREGSLGAWYWKALDTIAARSARTVLVDTNAHGDYLHQLTGISRDRFKRIFAGCDDEEVYPLDDVQPQEFTVHFHGYLVPFHGIETILAAARELKSDPIKFRIVTRLNGAGRKVQAHALDLPHVIWHDEVPRAELNRMLGTSSVVLGVFGNTPKLQHVIPNKIFEGLAAKRPVITAESAAVRELLTNGENCMLVPAGNPQALTRAIRKLFQDSAFAQTIGQNGYNVYKQNATPFVIGNQVKSLIESLL